MASFNTFAANTLRTRDFGIKQQKTQTLTDNLKWHSLTMKFFYFFISGTLFVQPFVVRCLFVCKGLEWHALEPLFRLRSIRLFSPSPHFACRLRRFFLLFAPRFVCVGVHVTRNKCMPLKVAVKCLFVSFLFSRDSLKARKNDKKNKKQKRKIKSCHDSFLPEL